MSYRNRCEIAGANGRIALSVPLEGGRDQKVVMKDLRIAQKEEWQRRHWASIYSAYGRSPYFENYAPELSSFFQKPYTWLLDWNTDLLEWTNRQLGFEPVIGFTKEYISRYPESEISDFRNQFCPKNKAFQDEGKPMHYWQVFEEKNGFVAGLSIIDLLFCMGPASGEWLRNA